MLFSVPPIPRIQQYPHVHVNTPTSCAPVCCCYVVTSKVSNSLVPQTLRASPSSCHVEEEAVFHIYMLWVLQLCCIPVVHMCRSSDYGVHQMVALVRRLDVQIIHLSLIRGQSVCSGEFSFV